MPHKTPSPLCSSTQAPGQAPAGSLDVWSCGTSLPDEVRAACMRSDHIFASDKLLCLLPAGSATLHSLLPSPRKALLSAARLAEQGARVSLLSTGDALYHGLGSTLVSVVCEAWDLHSQQDMARLPFALCFHPGITAFQALCHRVGIVWSDAELFCAHHAPLQPWRVLQARTAIVYAGLPLTAAMLAKQFCAFDPASADRECVLAENLGTEEEHIHVCTLAEAAAMHTCPTSILVLLPHGHRPRPLPLGLEDESFHFERHCLTNRYIRPVVLSCLRLPGQGVLWDLGAGSGSVGLEAALLQKELTVCAVEKSAARCANIVANAARLGAPNLHLTMGDICAVMPSLPAPDRIFVGGGGRDLPQILTRALTRLDGANPDARLVVTAITLETVAMLAAFEAGECLEALSLDVAVRTPMATGSCSYLAPANRIHIFTFRPRTAK